ncbi:hypothetical protein Vafri_5261 [Volvox africanus]|uniref:Uncharacterized protein n=1 Tax=Volvox africanus TaxID=51714 RepID=A0A8J4AZS4_9CHLO|nr:hypothetical protein Vafri_5261 [Volvox africanus]
MPSSRLNSDRASSPNPRAATSGSCWSEAQESRLAPDPAPGRPPPSSPSDNSPECNPSRICTRCPALLRNPAVAITISRAHMATRTATATGSPASGQPPTAMNASPG